MKIKTWLKFWTPESGVIGGMIFGAVMIAVFKLIDMLLNVG